MASKHSLEDLLNLSLGTPEIGAVNFNYLYEVIHEILKHLGIANKQAGTVEDFDYRVQSLSGRSTPLPEVQEESNVETDNAALKSDKAAKSSDEQIMSKENDPKVPSNLSDIKEPTIFGENRQQGSHQDISKRRSSHSDEQNQVTRDQKDETSLARRKSSEKKLPQEESSGKESSNNEDGYSKASQHKPTSAKSSNGNDRVVRRQSVSPTGYTAARRGSNASTGFPERRLSLVANANDGTLLSNQDILLINRSLDRRDSKTPAGDMWQILNVNRRLEAAEATIQGMTGLIDNLSTDISEIRGSIKSAKDTANESKVVPKDDQGMRIEKEYFDQVSTSIQNMEDLMKTCVTKSDLSDFCSLSQVESLIEERLSSQPASTASEQPPRRKESRTKLLQDALSRIMKLEEGSIFLNEEFERMKFALSTKADNEDQEKIAQLETQVAELKQDMIMMQPVARDVNEMKEQIKNMSETADTLKYISDQIAKEQSETTSNISKIGKELETLTDTVHTKMGSVVNTQAVKSEQDDISKLKTMLSALKEEHSSLDDEFLKLRKELKEGSKRFELIEGAIEDVKIKKLGKDEIEKMLSLKADKSQIEDKITQQQFDSCMVHLDKNIQDVMQRIDGQETILKQFICKMETRLEKTIGQDDLQKLRDNLENRMKTFKVSVQEPMSPEDGAAGFRKPLLRNFHCISCDRPLEMLQEDAMPTLPMCQALPGSRAIRPYTTFELEQIRKHVRGTGSNKDRYEAAHERERLQKQLLRLCGAHDLDELTARSARSCGGSHTLLDPQKKSVVKTTLYYREDSLQIQAATEPVFEKDVMGRDGHIYKGQNEHLPPIVQKEITAGHPQNDMPIMPRPSIQQSRAEVDMLASGFNAQQLATQKLA